VVGPDRTLAIAEGVEVDGINHCGNRYCIGNRYRQGKRMREFLFSPLMAELA
jgi:hypothetical protein